MGQTDGEQVCEVEIPDRPLRAWVVESSSSYDGETKWRMCEKESEVEALERLSPYRQRKRVEARGEARAVVKKWSSAV